MKAAIKKILSSFGNFFGKKKDRRLLYLAAIVLFALIEITNSGLARKTFVFYSNNEGNIVTEERMLRRSPDRETDIRRYLDEVLLGPVSPDTALFFPRETRLNSFMYRDMVVYANLSEEAALPLPEGRDVFRSLLALNEGIRRNFPQVKNVKLFIGGNEVFFEDFSRIFIKSADNSKTSP